MQLEIVLSCSILQKWLNLSFLRDNLSLKFSVNLKKLNRNISVIPVTSARNTSMIQTRFRNTDGKKLTTHSSELQN